MYRIKASKHIPLICSCSLVLAESAAEGPTADDTLDDLAEQVPVVRGAAAHEGGNTFWLLHLNASWATDHANLRA